MRIAAANPGDPAARQYAGARGRDLDISHPFIRRVLATLDVELFTEVLAHMGGDRPVSRHAILAIMHKIRAQYRFHKLFTDGQQRLSKRWLREHGFTTKLHDEKMEEIQSD